MIDGLPVRVRSELDRFATIRRWRHLLVAFAGLAAAIIAEAAIADIVLDKGAAVGGMAALPGFIGLFLTGTLVASFGWQRFHLGRALARFPLAVLAVVSVCLVLMLAASMENTPNVSADDSPVVPLVSGAVDDHGGLAGVLLDPDQLAAVLGVGYHGPEPIVGSLVRSRSVARYQGEGKKVLTLTVGPRRHHLPNDRERRHLVALFAEVGGWQIEVSAYGPSAADMRSGAQRVLATAARRLAGAAGTDMAAGADMAAGTSGAGLPA